LCKKFYDIAKHANEENNTTKLLHKHLDTFVFEYGQPRHEKHTTNHNMRGDPEQPTSSTSTTTVNIIAHVHTPIVVKRKGARDQHDKYPCLKKL